MNKKNAIIAVSALTVLALASTFIFEPERKAGYDEISGKTMSFDVNDDEKPDCSATAVSKVALLTAEHCFKTASVYETFGPEIQVFRDKHDHMLVVFSHEVFSEYATISKESVRIGDEVQIVGSPAGSSNFYRKGYVASFDIEAEEIYYDLNAHPGDSGSGIFNSKGELIAVLTHVKTSMISNSYLKIAASYRFSFTDEELRAARIIK